MGYLEIHRPDGTIIYLGDPQPMHTEKIEVCDTCNEPRAESEMMKTNLATKYEQSLGIDDVIWECYRCKGVNKS